MSNNKVQTPELSPAKLAANRRNSKLSTGPRSPQGKAVASRNSIKHGILSSKIVITDEGGEDPALFEQLRAVLVEDLNPQSQFEALLVEKIAADFWRLRRVLGWEAALASERFSDARSSAGTPPSQLSEARFPRSCVQRQELEAQYARYVRARAFPTEGDLNLIVRYEGAIQRSIQRSLTMLRDLQGSRE